MMPKSSLRSPELQKQYDFAIESGTLEGVEVLPNVDTGDDHAHGFRHWRLVSNQYPYEGFAVHHMLVPRQMFELVENVPSYYWTELRWIIENYCQTRYDIILENTELGRSVPHTIVVHLLRYTEMEQ